MSPAPDSAETESPDLRRREGLGYQRIVLPSPPEKSSGQNHGGAAPPAASRNDQALSDALAPVVRKNVERALRENPEVVVDIVYPVIGRVIRKSISEAIKSLMAAIENSARSAFSMKRIKWRLQSWRTGKPFQQIVLENSLIFRVEEVLLIHRPSGLLALHESLDAGRAQDRELVSGMLTAIEDFARDSFRDSFHLDKGANLSSLDFGELQLLVKASPHALLAAAVRGMPNQAVKDHLADALVTIHERFVRQLASYDGDSSSLQPIQPILRGCLLSQASG